MRRFLNFLLAGLALTVMALPLRAADLQLEARLIWGANDSNDSGKYHLVDPELAGKLHRTFKWKYYYEITNKTASISVNKSSDLKMSAACTIRVKNLGGSRVEVNCIGQGKPIHKGNYTLLPPQWLVLGGNSTDNTAWFVGLRAVDAKTVASKN